MGPACRLREIKPCRKPYHIVIEFTAYTEEVWSDLLNDMKEWGIDLNNFSSDVSHFELKAKFEGRDRPTDSIGPLTEQALECKYDVWQAMIAGSNLIEFRTYLADRKISSEGFYRRGEVDPVQFYKVVFGLKEKTTAEVARFVAESGCEFQWNSVKAH